MPGIASTMDPASIKSIGVKSIVSGESVYFQFPIRALNMGKKIDDVTEDDAQARIQLIVGYCLVEYGKTNFAKAGEVQGFEVARRYSESKACGTACNPSNRKNAELLFAANGLQVDLYSDVAVVRKHHEDFNQLDGGNMFVRLRRDFFWSVNRGEMSWREWSILCGVYAMVGNRPKVKLSYATLNALALGYNGQKTIPGYYFTNLRLTDRQTQTTVDRLKSRGFFSKASPNRRHNYYSMKPQEELENMLAKMEAKKVIKANETKATEQTKRIRDMVSKMVEDEQKAKSRSAPTDVARK
jgi:hypothetical protein